MGHQRIKISEYAYKEKDRRLKEPFINGINGDQIRTEIIRKLTAVKETNKIASDQVLEWVRGAEAQRLQKKLIEATKGNITQSLIL